jgi:asparagine synthase (glutamine-hydrolysing)
LESQLREAVSQRMVADVDLGALLSGGIDSSMIVALMQAQSSRPIRTFSIGFEEPDYDEAPYARAVAAHLGTEHTELIISHRETREVIPTLPTLFDEPFADASQIPTWIVSQMTRRHVTVALSGDGGDELFAGYNRYYRALKEWDRWRRSPRALRSAGAIGLHALARAGWRTLGPGRNGAPTPLPVWRRYLGKLEKTVRSMPAESLADLYARTSASYGPARELVVGAQAASSPLGNEAVRTALDDPMRRLMLIDFCGYLADDILVKVDRASMSVGLEVRAPFLDHRVVELAWSFPTAFSVEPGARQGKRVLRELLGRHVPRELFERRKLGFGVPIGEWLHGPLRGWAEDLLSPERLARQGILRPEAVQRVWRQHLSGWSNHDNLLWSLLMFEAWLDGQRPPKRLQSGMRRDVTTI